MPLTGSKVGIVSRIESMHDGNDCLCSNLAGRNPSTWKIDIISLRIVNEYLFGLRLTVDIVLLANYILVGLLGVFLPVTLRHFQPLNGMHC